MKPTVVALIALAALAPRTADAQDPPQLSTQDAAPATMATADPADRLTAEAYRLFHDRKAWRRAAHMLEQAAEMREPGDADRVNDLLSAARVYGHAGATRDARRAFEAAADAATARGAVRDAAHAFLDAAIVAARSGDRAGANALIEKSLLLSESPHLDARTRGSILQRVLVDRG